MGFAYKVLMEGFSLGGTIQWHLPEGKQPGAWMPSIRGKLIPCYHGYHLCEEKDLIFWLGPEIYIAEWRGEILECENKIVAREVRLIRKVMSWNKRTAREFACDCAERVLPLYENAFPEDNRLRKVIAVARLYAQRGEVTDEERQAIELITKVAVQQATWVNWECAWAARTLVRIMIKDAGQAAREAALAARNAAATGNERIWQTQRLMEILGDEGRLP